MNRDIIKNPEDLRKYRIKLFRDAMMFKKTERIPFCGNLVTWKFLDCGYSLDEAARDYSVIEKCVEHAAATYEVDMLGDEGYRNPLKVIDTLGGSSQYAYNERGEVYVKDIPAISEGDYDAFTENFIGAFYSKAFFNKYPNAKTMSSEELAAAAEKYVEFQTSKQKTIDKLAHTYGMPTVLGRWSFMPAFEYLFLYLRGIKALSIDLRRHPQKVEDFCETVDGNNYAGVISAIQGKKTDDVILSADNMAASEEDFCIDIYYPLLGHTILNIKQFEKLYWKNMKKVFDVAEQNNRICYGFAEGAWDRLGDYFNEYKRGTISMEVEQDNVYTLREKYPNIGLWGGLDVTTMGHGTSQECIDMAKKAIDVLGKDGGFVLAPNKMVSYSYDMNSDNLKATAHFVANYKIN